jgi:hypothetical protein
MLIFTAERWLNCPFYHHCIMARASNPTTPIITHIDAFKKTGSSQLSLGIKTIEITNVNSRKY